MGFGSFKFYIKIVEEVPDYQKCPDDPWTTRIKSQRLKVPIVKALYLGAQEPELARKKNLHENQFCCTPVAESTDEYISRSTFNSVPSWSIPEASI